MNWIHWVTISLTMSLPCTSLADSDPLSEFKESLVGFSCVSEDDKRAIILLGSVDGQLRLLSDWRGPTDEPTVSETKEGYRFSWPNHSHFLNELDSGWQLFGATSKGPFSANCSKLGSLPRVMFEKILEQSDQVRTAQVRHLEEKIERLEILERQLRNDNERLSAQVIDLKKEIDQQQSDPLGLLENPADPEGIPKNLKTLMKQVQPCWVVNVGGQEAKVSVTVSFNLDRNGKLVGPIELVSSSFEEKTATERAFQSVRRAVLRCQKSGYQLPPEEYASWKSVEMTFDPRN